MPHPIQTVEDVVSLPVVALTDVPRSFSSKIMADIRSLKSPLRMLTGLFLSPLLLIAAMFGLVVVVADFALFRLRSMRNGHPRPKGLWEF